MRRAFDNQIGSHSTKNDSQTCAHILDYMDGEITSASLDALMRETTTA